MASRILLTVFGLAGAVVACGQSKASSERGGEGATSGSSGATGGGGAGGEGGGTSDYDVLSTCASGSCERQSYAQLVEAYSHNIERTSVNCVLTALRDRTPGLYVHQTDSTFSNGSVGAHHAIVVLPDGAASYARRRYSYPDGVPSDPEPGLRCVLKPSSYFEACLAALMRASSMDAEAWRCAFGDGAVTTPSTLEWFESCEPESPATCP